MQSFKNVYFADFPSDDPSRRNLTLAFPENDAVWRSVANLTSHELRGLLGTASYADLRSQASKARVTLNAFCHQRLQESLDTLGPTSALDPIQATFRGSADDPMQRWFPFLEGYSPSFVSEILKQYVPKARTVYDPFAGMGTTPLTVARGGRKALYSELNPLMQAVTQVKADVLALGPKRSIVVRRELDQMTMSVLTAPDQFAPAADLMASYSRVFGAAEYFDRDTLEDVLRLRGWCDDATMTTDPVTARLVELATLGALVPSSRLIRAGDLRYRRSSEVSDPRPIRMLVAEKLEQMAADVLQLGNEQPAASITLVCEDVRDLKNLPPLGLDAIVTSPPYLNGTNYFRNTKLELWFLRRLRASSDLRRYRSKSVVAGINDVAGPQVHVVPAAVRELVANLETVAYDRRIPRMVGSYFADMQLVFGLIRRHLQPASIIAIDIGDSVYAGTRVATDEIFVDLLRDAGFELIDQVILRRRQSRDGTELRQTLLVLSGGTPTRVGPPPAPPETWTKFRNDLPHTVLPLSKRNWGHPLHSLCSYQGKMKPSLAASLVSAVVKQGDRVLDPFGGVGTIPFEAAANGATTFTFEISPAALSISRAKLDPPTESELEAALSDLETYLPLNPPSVADLEQATSFGLNGAIAEFYHQKTLGEIISARRYFLEVPDSRGSNFVRACLLHVLHGNRPYALSRRSHPITPFAPSGPSIYKSLVESVRAKVARTKYLDMPTGFIPGTALAQDATAPWEPAVDNLDVILTSPPFFDSTRFHTGNWLRLWFSGWDPADFRKNPRLFVDERQKDSFDVYAPVLRQSRERLRADGLLVLHLGLSERCDMASEIERVARPWFRRVDRFSESVGHLEGHGISDRGGTQAHQFLVLG